MLAFSACFDVNPPPPPSCTHLTINQHTRAITRFIKPPKPLVVEMTDVAATGALGSSPSALEAAGVDPLPTPLSSLPPLHSHASTVPSRADHTNNGHSQPPGKPHGDGIGEIHENILQSVPDSTAVQVAISGTVV